MSDKKNHDVHCPEKYYTAEMCKFCELINTVRNECDGVSQAQLHDTWMAGYEKGYANAIRDVKISRGEL